MEEPDELYLQLDDVAKRLNSLRKRWFALVQYDMMSDALWWRDEIPLFSRKAEDYWCLRPVFRYRTCLIAEEDGEEWLRYWNRGLELFPLWPGFHSSRTTPNKRLAALYRRQSQIAMDSFMDGIDDDDLEEEPGHPNV